jgi:uncharacterized protein (UPF0264 family)
VRSVAEALAALAGGANIIDVKEPSNGPLGAPRVGLVGEIVEAIGGRAPITVAAGELIEGSERAIDLARVPGVSMVKLGLSRLGDADRRRRLLGELCDQRPVGVGLTPCVYADAAEAQGPEPEELLDEAARLGFGWLLVDTWRKEGAGLFHSLDPRRVGALVERGRERGVAVALAGQLRGDTLVTAARLGAPLIGVRGAVCSGGRDGEVGEGLVADVVRLVARGASEDDG